MQVQGEVDDIVQEARNAEEKAKKAITDVSPYDRLNNVNLICPKGPMVAGLVNHNKDLRGKL